MLTLAFVAVLAAAPKPAAPKPAAPKPAASCEPALLACRDNAATAAEAEACAATTSCQAPAPACEAPDWACLGDCQSGDCAARCQSKACAEVVGPLSACLVREKAPLFDVPAPCKDACLKAWGLAWGGARAGTTQGSASAKASKRYPAPPELAGTWLDAGPTSAGALLVVANGEPQPNHRRRLKLFNGGFLESLELGLPGTVLKLDVGGEARFTGDQVELRATNGTQQRFACGGRLGAETLEGEALAERTYRWSVTGDTLALENVATKARVSLTREK